MKLKRLAHVLLAMVLCVSFLSITASAASKPKTPVVEASNVASSGKIKLTWDAVKGAEKYEVYRSTSKNGEYARLITTTKTSVTNSSIAAGEAYYYKVRAVSASGAKSSYSAVVNRTCDLPRPDVTAKNVSSTGKIKLSWDKIDGAVEYEVYRATSKSGTYKLLATTSNTSITNTSATAGKTYYYKVKAIHSKSAANSAYSSIDSRTCDLARPEVKASNVASSGKIKLSWNKVSGAEEYKVYRATKENGEYKLMKTTTSTSYTNTSASAGKTYYYKVKAVHSNSAANSASSSAVKRTCDLARPVVTVSNSSSTGNIKLSWKAVSGAKSYEVYRSKSSSGDFTRISTVTGTSLTNSSASVNTTYYYKVRAIASNSGANSAYSSVKSGKIPGTYKTSYVALPTFTLYEKADGSGDSVTLKYMTKVYLKEDLTGSEGTLYRARYNNKAYYAWQAKGDKNFTSTYSNLNYSSYTTTSTQDDIIEKALFYLDVPTEYVQGTVGEKVSGKYRFDCSGFASHVLNTVYQKEDPSYDLTSNLTKLYNSGTKVSKANMKPGDIVFFKLSSSSSKTVDHCGIYLGKNEFIHATTAVDGVTRAPLGGQFAIVGIRRY